MIIFAPDKKPKPTSSYPDGQQVQRSFVVNLENGLHARPCALLVKTLQSFLSDVRVEANGEEASGHSVMSLMALAAGFGCGITFTIIGADAPQAMAAVAHLFATHFADAYRAPKRPGQALVVGR